MNGLFGSIEHQKIITTTKSGIVTFNNINGKQLDMDLERLWKTTTVGSNMFIKVGRSELSLYEFFIPDLFYSISKLLRINSRWTVTSKQKLTDLILAIKTNTWYKDFFIEKPVGLDFKKLKELTVTLLPVQETALNEYNRLVVSSHLRGYLLGAATGSGKSVMSLALTLCLDSSPGIIICPKSLVNDVWVFQIKSMIKKEKSIYIADTSNPPIKNYDYYIFHYEALGLAVNFFKRVKVKNPVIILDESHNLNDVNSLRSQQYLKLCEETNCQNIVHASGTPVKAIGYERHTVY